MSNVATKVECVECGYRETRPGDINRWTCSRCKVRNVLPPPMSTSEKFYRAGDAMNKAGNSFLSAGFSLILLVLIVVIALAFVH